MKGIIFITLLMAVSSHPAEDRESVLMQHDFDELLLKVKERHDSYSSADDAGRLEILRDIGKVIADLGTLKEEITSVAVAADDDGSYKLSILMGEAQAKHNELSNCHDAEVLDIHCIGRTVEVLVEEAVGAERDADEEAEASVLDEEEDEEEEIKEKSAEDIMLKQLLDQAVNEGADKGDMRLLNELDDLVDQEKEDLEKAAKVEAEKIAQMEAEKKEAEKKEAEEKEAARLIEEAANQEAEERVKADEVEGAIAKLSPAEQARQAALDMEREEMEEKLKALENM